MARQIAQAITRWFCPWPQCGRKNYNPFALTCKRCGGSR